MKKSYAAPLLVGGLLAALAQFTPAVAQSAAPAMSPITLTGKICRAEIKFFVTNTAIQVHTYWFKFESGSVEISAVDGANNSPIPPLDAEKYSRRKTAILDNGAIGVTLPSNAIMWVDPRQLPDGTLHAQTALNPNIKLVGCG